MLRYLICILVSFSSFIAAKSASPDWECNPHRFRYDMSLYFELQLQYEVVNPEGYKVAAFHAGECRGVAAMYTHELLPRPYLHMRIRSNRAKGDTIVFRYYNEATGDTAQAATRIVFHTDSLMGYPSQPIAIQLEPCYVQVTTEAGPGGKVTGAGMYEEGTALTLTAIADEGFHFEQWHSGTTDNPLTLTATYDTLLCASFTPNVYDLRYWVADSLWSVQQVAYGSEIVPLEGPDDTAEIIFKGWKEIPVTMPAHDVDVHADIVADIDSPLRECGAERVNVYTLQGICVGTSLPMERLSLLPRGCYVINGNKVFVK